MGKLVFWTVILSYLQCFGVTSLSHETYIISSFVTSALANIQWKTVSSEVLRKKIFNLMIIDNEEVFNDVPMMEGEKDEYTSINLALYEDDEITGHIATWSIKTINSQSNTIKSFINYTVTDTELDKCYNKLGIIKTTEPRLAYLCFLWSQEPYYSVWIIISFVALFYFIFPISNSIMYIRNIKTSTGTTIRTGFLKLAGRNQYFTKNIKPKGRTVFVMLAIICVVTTTLLNISLYVFFMDLVFDQTTGLFHSVHIINMNKGARVSLTIFSCLSFIFLPAFQPYYSSLSIPICNLFYDKIDTLFTQTLKIPLSDEHKTTLAHKVLIFLTRLVLLLLFLMTVIFFLVEFLIMTFLIIFKDSFSLYCYLCCLFLYINMFLHFVCRPNLIDFIFFNTNSFFLYCYLWCLFLPLLPLFSFWYKEVIIPLSDVGTTLVHSVVILLTRLVLFLLTIVFFQVEFATFSLFYMSYLIIYKVPFLINDMFTHLIVLFLNIGSQETNLNHILSFAFFTETEKTAWISKVNEYTTNISDRLRSNWFHNYLTKNPTVNTNSQVSILHTGSIPSRLGKPLMLLGDLPRVICDSFPELHSDHDVMFSLDHLPVSESGLYQEYNMFRITIQADRPEFVYLHTNEDSDQASAREECHIENTEASKFMVKAITESFFTPEGKMTKEARAIPALSDISELYSWLLGCLHKDYSYKFLVECAGPSVNLKITLVRGYVIFDCDFLLSLPLIKWPSPAKEWLTRQRKWPDAFTIARLSSLPCHIIPKPRNEKDTHSWRFSFSNQELELTNSLPEKARLCYIGLKLIFKKYLKCICPQLKSYHMLTMFFWFMEQHNEESTRDNRDKNMFVVSLELETGWAETKIMLVKLLLHVSSSLRSGYLHHFFIRNVNLHPGNSKEMSKLVTRIEEIVHNGEDALLKDKLVCDVSILNPSLFQRLLQDRL